MTRPPRSGDCPPPHPWKVQARPLASFPTRTLLTSRQPQPPSFLRATNGTRVFSNPSKVSQALHTSTLGKYILEGETRSLGNGSALIITIGESNIFKVPELQLSTFQLGDWTVTSRRADKGGDTFRYAWVGPLADDVDLEAVRKGFNTFDGGEVVEITWLPPHCLPRTTIGRWLRLKCGGPHGPRSVYCPLNCQAQQTYINLTQEGHTHRHQQAPEILTAPQAAGHPQACPS
ncbi:uncharacterized protein LOC123508006 [Portunus trituberculatus]|uniref:uncharacterized protein LOC123508006 n=1 Tax=Portunus trituberculatus TaxID=210409 RepID=UPI001E1CEC10|nr:uncharacterized protein LOC123508006 [Portunus trituberculatus]